MPTALLVNRFLRSSCPCVLLTQSTNIRILFLELLIPIL
nr:MAG TPA: hypothetical protein [Bacteriophage sp.]